jgi:hypothetical protein
MKKSIKTKELKWIGIDCDDTIANNTGYPDFKLTTPIKGAKEACEELNRLGYKVTLYTARPWSEYNIIEDWLQKYNFPIKRIICGKPLFRCIIDDKNIEFKGNWKTALGKAIKG